MMTLRLARSTCWDRESWFSAVSRSINAFAVRPSSYDSTSFAIIASFVSWISIDRHFARPTLPPAILRDVVELLLPRNTLWNAHHMIGPVADRQNVNVWSVY